MEENAKQSGAPQTNAKHWFRETIELIFLALIIVAPIRLFVVNPFIVSGASMIPTFDDGEYLIVDQLSYRFEDPKRGEVIIFRYPKDPSKFFIKRIIGLPGETVSISRGKVTVEKENGQKVALDESYVRNNSNESGTYALGDSEYFVMGDNRISSSDSRVWGTLDRGLIVGRALLRLFPVSEAAVFPGNYAGTLPE